jgi:hypothetical protein
LPAGDRARLTIWCVEAPTPLWTSEIEFSQPRCPREDYDRSMPTLPTILLVPLFVAGLVMMPFLIPFFDRKAKQDLAAYRASQEQEAQDANDEGDES